MKRKNLALAFIVLMGVLHLASCSSTESAIIGKWQEIGGEETMEFFKDGTITGTALGMSFGGKYNFVDKDRIKIELGGIGAIVGPRVVKVEISGNELSMTDSNGKVSKYRRAK
jgi:hypothetical protein